MENKGCQVLLGVIGLALAVGMVAPMFGNMGAQQQDQQDPVVFTVGDKKVTYSAFNDRMQTLGQSSQYPPGTAIYELDSAVKAVQGFVNNAAVASLASEKGVSITESNIQGIAEKASKQAIEQLRFSLSQSGQLKPDATQEDADKMIAQLYGKSPDQLVQDQVKDIVEKFKDEKTKSDVVSGLLPTLLQEKYEESTTYTEEDLKKSYQEYNLSVLRFDDLKKSLSEREDDAVAALDKLGSGTDFAAVQKEYAPNAKPEDLSTTLTIGLLETSSDLKPLIDLKPGEVSEIMTINGSPTIYKLNSIKPNLPPDFEMDKEALIKSNKAQRAGQARDEALKAKVESYKPDFKDKGLEIAYEVSMDFANPEYAADPAKLKEYLEGKMAEMRDPEFVSEYFPNLVVAVQFTISEYLFATATEEEKKELLDERIETAQNMLATFEDNGFRFSFASELLNMDRPDVAYQLALNAAENNGDYEMMGQMMTDQITALTDQAVKDKKWNTEQETEIRAELKRWQDERDRYLQEQKEVEEAAKKAQEELDKETVPPTGTEGTGSTEPTTTEPETATKPEKEGN